MWFVVLIPIHTTTIQRYVNKMHMVEMWCKEVEYSRIYPENAIWSSGSMTPFLFEKFKIQNFCFNKIWKKICTYTRMKCICVQKFRMKYINMRSVQKKIIHELLGWIVPCVRMPQICLFCIDLVSTYFVLKIYTHVCYASTYIHIYFQIFLKCKNTNFDEFWGFQK